MKATTSHGVWGGKQSNHIKAFVRVGPLMSVAAVVQELGCEPGPIFDSAGLKPAQFTDPDFEVPYIHAGRLPGELRSSYRLPALWLAGGSTCRAFLPGCSRLHAPQCPGCRQRTAQSRE